MYSQPRFSAVTAQQVTGALKATGSTDLDVLAAAKDQISAPYRPLKWFGIWGIVTGTLCCLLVVFAFLGVPLLIFGVWAIRRAKKNREIIETAYNEYVAKVTGKAVPLVPGDLRTASLGLLTLLALVPPAYAQVPEQFHGDWVSARATCDAPLRFRVEAARVTLINGKDQQVIGGIEMAGPSYFGPDYNGIQAVMITEFEGDQPVTAIFNANEKKGVADVSYTELTGQVQPAYQAQASRLKKLDLPRRFPLKGVPLKKCGAASGGGAAAPGLKQASAGPSVCKGKAGCSETPQMAVAVEDFRITTGSGRRYAAVTLRITNRTGEPVTMGYVAGSGLVTDDRGNRYTISGPVRGLGEITGSTFDPKFTLQPGEARDARFEFAWSQSQNQIFGTQFALDLTTRDILAAGANQYQLGQERTWRFTGLTDMGEAAPAPVAATPVSSAGAQQPIRPAADPCGVDGKCFFAGPFAAQVTQVNASKGGGGYQFVKLNVRFTNLGTAPLILCYTGGSASGSDDRGNRYAVHQPSVRGIGTCAGGVADPQFTLQPNQSREATFEYRTGIYRGTVLGTVWTAGFTATELELLPGNQIQTGREFLVSFKDLTDGSSAGAPVVASGGDVPATTVSSGATRAEGTACVDRKWCDDVGPFVAQVTRVSPTKASGYQFVTLNVKVKNMTEETLILCYLSGSALGTDERGNRYGTRNEKVRGIGICSGSSLNPQFALKAGESRDWSIDYFTGIYRGVVLGVEWKADFTLQRLRPIPGNQIQTDGEFAVNFEGLSAGGSTGGSDAAATTAGAAKGLFGEIEKAIKKK